MGLSESSDPLLQGEGVHAPLPNPLPQGEGAGLFALCYTPLMETLLLSGETLTIDEVVAVAHGRPVALDPAAVPAMMRSRAAVDQLVAEGRVVYGITTGFGRFKDRVISADEVRTSAVPSPYTSISAAAQSSAPPPRPVFL